MVSKALKEKKGEYFYVYKGGVLKNLQDLVNALKKMNEDIYKYHTIDHGNDFVNWITHSLEFPDLGKMISGKNKEEVIRIIEEYIKEDENTENTKNTKKIQNNNIKKEVRSEYFQDNITPTFKNWEDTIPKEISNEIENAEEELSTLIEKVKEYQKKGYKFMELNLLLRWIRLKIKIAKSSWKKEDIEKVKGLIKEAKEKMYKEIKENEEDISKRSEFLKYFNEDYLTFEKKYKLRKRLFWRRR